jgi:type I restriction enzyme M protein
MSDGPVVRNHAAFIWSVADLLRGDYKPSDYGKVILPMVVLRRLDCVLEASKPAVLKRYANLTGRIENIEPVLQAASGQQFFNISPLDSAVSSTTRRTWRTTCALTPPLTRLERET